MRSRLSALLAICICAMSSLSAAPGQVPASTPRDPGYIAEDPQLVRLVGKPAPSLTLRAIDGSTVSSYGRKPVYLKLWATYCLPCRAQMPGFEHIYDTYRDRMQIVAVNAGVGDDPDKVKSYVQSAKLRMPVAVDDGRLGAWLKMEATPLHVLIGRDGKIAYVGHQDGPALDMALQKVLDTPASRGRIETTTLEGIATLRPGDTVPRFELRNATDTPVGFASGATSKPRAVLFTATWCESYLKDTEPGTVEACQRTRQLADELSQTSQVEWLGVTEHLWTTPASLASYQARVKPRIPMAIDSDGRAFRLFGVGRIPAVALIDRNGRLVRVVGPDDRDLAAAITALGR